MSNTNEARYLITGNTYAHQDSIKRLGGTWDKAKRGYIVSADAAAKLTNPTWIGRRAARELTASPLVSTPAAAPVCPSCGTVCYGDCKA